jgi:stress response protein SCP2
MAHIGPAKGKTASLQLTAEGTSRFLVGLSWAPKDGRKRKKIEVPHLRDENGHYDNLYFFKLPVYIGRVLVQGIVGLLPQKVAAPKADNAANPSANPADGHDLDLYCYIFDRNMQLYQVIGPMVGVLIDPSQKIYHSGENQQGKQGNDAEQIFVETRNLPPDYHNFIFVVKSANSNAMSDIPEGIIRLADSATNANALENHIAEKDQPPANSFGYVFCCVTREGDQWAFRNIDSFTGRAVDWSLMLPAIEWTKGTG